MPEFQGIRTVSVDKTEDLDGIRLRIHDPGLRNTAPFVEGIFYPAIDGCGPFGQDFKKENG